MHEQTGRLLHFHVRRPLIVQLDLDESITVLLNEYLEKLVI